MKILIILICLWMVACTKKQVVVETLPKEQIPTQEVSEKVIEKQHIQPKTSTLKQENVKVPEVKKVTHKKPNKNKSNKNKSNKNKSNNVIRQKTNEKNPSNKTVEVCGESIVIDPTKFFDPITCEYWKPRNQYEKWFVSKEEALKYYYKIVNDPAMVEYEMTWSCVSDVVNNRYVWYISVIK